MSLQALLNRPCTITHRAPGTTTDQYGNLVQDVVADTTVCELQAQVGADEADGVITENWTLFLPAGTLIDGGDAVTVDGDTYEVQGAPWHARNPRTQAQSHVECRLRRTTGTAP